MWPSRRLLDLLRIEHPIIQAPMAGHMDGDLVAAVSEAGGFGCLPCAMLNAEKLREEVGKIRARTTKPIGLNFFCHTAPVPNNAREAAWRERLAPYYRELGIDPAAPVPFFNRAPFDEALLEAVLETRPEAVSFHFGLPPAPLYESSSAKVFWSSARPPRWRRRAGLPSAGSMRLSRRVSRRAAIAACS